MHDSGTGACVEGIHHVELYVTDVDAAARFYRTSLGLRTIGALLADGSPTDRRSIVMERDQVRLVLTAPLADAGEVADHLRTHGEGVKDIALSVRHVDQLAGRAIARGARLLLPPVVNECGGGVCTMARVGACGDLVHSLIGGTSGDVRRLPGFAPTDEGGAVPDTAIDGIDHIALAVGAGELDTWVDFYVAGLGFRETHREDVSTEYSAMRSKVVEAPDRTVRFPMMEPAYGRRTSQIDEYVRSHCGPGAQHLALSSHDIVKSVSTMAAGIEFLATPASYYDSLEARVGDVSAELDALRRRGILVDRDRQGTLLQVFTKPIGPRPTLFLEIVERRGAEGFGSGNIKALFEAVERMQAAQGGS